MTEANTPSPDEDRELIARLTRKTQRFPAMGGASIGADADGRVTSTSYVTDDGYRLVNPDGPAAADRLESLLSDREQGLGGISGSREPSPSCTGLGPTGFDPGRVVDAFNKRLTIYRTKRDAADPFAEDTYNRQDATRYVVEAIEILAREAGLSDVVHIEPSDD